VKEDFGHADFVSNGKENDACTDKGVIMCQGGKL